MSFRPMISPEFIRRFAEVAKSPEPDLAPAALLIARLEYPRLDASRYLDELDTLGEQARAHVGTLAEDDSPLVPIQTLNRYLFDELQFEGNRNQYDDPRNSCLNAVLDRRTGIPITLSLVYLEIARRAGLALEGINFPGHFLLRVASLAPGPIGAFQEDLIVDPFHRGAILSSADCERLLHQHVGTSATFDPRLLVRATKLQILIRMLVNLKRVYVKMRSFPQARTVADLLLALNPSALSELRDRGLLSYHLNDFPAALRDLESYLRFTRSPSGEREADDEDEDEQNDPTKEIWAHVKNLRRRVASLS